MKIIKSFPAELDDRSAYKLTRSQSVQKMQDAAGSTLTPSAWVLFEDEDSKTGELKNVLVLQDNGELFGTISKTFITSFMDIVDHFGGNVGSINVISGKAKSGRDYITCELA